MDISNDWLATFLRGQAWARAKGELQAVLVTITANDEYDTAKKLVEKFINNFEDNGCHE